MYLDGYKYWLAYQKGDESYYRCFRSKTMKCKGKIVMESGKVKNIHEHSHEKETKITIVDKFRKILTKKAIEKPAKSLVEIYLEEALNFSEASILYPFQMAESTMRKARAKQKPKVNKVVGALTEPEHPSGSHQQLQKHYFQDLLQEHQTTAIMMNSFSMNLLGKIEELHVDVSISCKSDDSHEDLHLVTVLAMLGHQDYPIAFGLLKVKSFATYSAFFKYVSDKAATAMTPNNILTSCDMELQEALKFSFPDATIKISWFCYASSVLKFAEDNGMLKLMNQNLFHLSSLKMILALPLIPSNYMIPGLDSLKKWMSEKNVKLNLLCEFIEASWLISDGAERISIFNGLSHSINNYVQVFNRDLLHSLNSPENIKKSQLLEAISKQATKAVAKLNKTKGTPPLKKAQKLQKTILETATHNWIKANIHLRRPIQFLQQVSHCIDDGMINFIINYDVSEKKVQSKLTEPPPLIFFNRQRNVVRPIACSSEPPPLVPILRKGETF